MRTFLLQELEQATDDLLHSPLSLKGNQDKWEYRKEGLVVKAALFDGFRHWEDWKVEVLAGKLLPLFGIDAVEQNSCMIDDGYGNHVYGSYSRDFRAPRERYVTFGRLLMEKSLTERFTTYPAQDKIKVAAEIFTEHLGRQRAEKFIEDMCLADYLFGNVDRHYDNYGLLIRRDETGTVVQKRPVPLYDFGMGLFQNQKEGLGGDLDSALAARLSSPFTIDLLGALEYYRDAWRARCDGMRVDLSRYDFPKGLGKAYLERSLASLGIGTEG